MSVTNTFAAVTSATGAQLDQNFADCLQLNAANKLTNALNHATSVVLASAGTVNIGAAASNNITISGAVTITAFDTIAEGALRIVTFTGAPQLTYNVTSMQLIGGASRTMNAGDVSLFRSLGTGNWKEELASGATNAIAFANGTTATTQTTGDSSTKVATDAFVMARPVNNAPVATTAGTSVLATGIPTWVKRITINFNGVGTSGTSAKLIQLGSGSVTNTGYVCVYSQEAPLALGNTTTSGFEIFSAIAADRLHGSYVLTLESASSNKWIINGSTLDITRGYIFRTVGYIALAGALDRINLTTVGGSDTFAAGEFNLMWE